MDTRAHVRFELLFELFFSSLPGRWIAFSPPPSLSLSLSGLLPLFLYLSIYLSIHPSIRLSLSLIQR